METFTFIRQLKHKGIDLALQDGELEIRYDETALTEEIIQDLKTHKEDLISFLQETQLNAPIPLAPQSKSYELSPSQRRLWILCQFEGRETSYHIPLIHAFDGQLDVAALRWALQQLVRRHEILRTVFRQDENDIVRQIVLSEKEAELAFSFSDVHKQAEAEELTSKGIQQLMDVPFDLETQPMLRAGVWRIAPQKYVFSLVVHHIICDNWSISILFKELLSLYKSARSGNGVALPPLAIQYKDYAHWINQHLEGANMQRHENYWLEQFSGELPVLALPTDRPRPAIKTANGSVYIKYFAPKLLQQLKDTCRKKGATLYMGLMAALNALLFKYTAQTDIIIGSPIAGREHPDLETQIGFYANTIALRTRFDKHDSFSSLLATVKETTLNGFDHQMYPFDGLVDKLKLERDMSRDPLFDVMLSLQNVDLFDKDIAAELLDGVQISKANFGESVVSRYDLVFDFFEAEQSLGLGLEYNTDLFDRSSVERMVAHFEQLLSVLLERTEEELGSLDFIQGKERMQLLETFNDTERENEQHTVVDRIEEQAGQQPDKIVFTQGDRQLTFAALNSSANRLAHCLQKEHGIGPNKIVSIGLERSERLLISILAVLKTGGGYLPIDPAYPADRIEYICTHSDCELMMDEEFFQRYEDNSSSELSDDNLSVQISADQLAYVIYTSGSTGRPKGVMITHGNLTNFILGMNDALPLEEFEQFLALTSVAFDISILELLWTLSNGMSLVLPAAGEDVLHGLDRYAGEGTYHMDFSLFYFASSAKDKNQQYDLLLESVRYADEHHFKGVWLPERHFHEFGGIFPNPSVVAAGLATITKNVELRSGSCVLPLHDTIRVAEEWSVVDNLSNGRVALSIASGWHADDFVFRPERFENRHKQMYAQIEELHHLWQGGTVQRRNGKGQEIEIGIFPKPFQDKLPIYITAAGNVETFRTAGRMGARVLTHLLGQNIEDVKEKIQAYREALLTAGHRVEDGGVVLMLHTFVGENLEEVREQVRAPFKSYLKSSASLINNLARELNMDFSALEESDLDNLLEIGFERYWNTAALFGTYESCRPLVEKLCDIGVTEIACLIDFGIAEKEVLGGLQHLNKLQQLFQKKVNSSAKKKQAISSMQITPSHLKSLLEGGNSARFLASLRHILVGGEAFPDDLFRRLCTQTTASIFNMYGPTETTIWSSHAKLSFSQKVNIGTPIRNTQMYVLDEQMNLCPIGVYGHIYIGGEGVANGYLKQESLTAEKFVSNPFRSGETIYQTGDIGRWLPNGELECIGRTDHQLKVRGYRIEPGEIEAVLRQVEGLSDCVLVAKEIAGQKSLIAFYESADELPEQSLVSHLKKQLPAYMMPAAFVRLPSIPMTPNGKVDRRALLEADADLLVPKTTYVAPEGALEEKLVVIWSEILNLAPEKIGTAHSFFQLGGNSLSVTQVISRVNKTFKIKVNIRNLFDAPTIHNLAEEIRFHQSQNEKKMNKKKLQKIEL